MAETLRHLSIAWLRIRAGVRHGGRLRDELRGAWFWFRLWQGWSI